jgi:hypothetical protein
MFFGLYGWEQSTDLLGVQNVIDSFPILYACFTDDVLYKSFLAHGAKLVL